MIKNCKYILIFLLIASSTLFSEDKTKSDTRIDVIYFHATIRCQTCLKIEEFTKNTVNFSFEKELKEGTITFSSLDFLASENEHFQNDYNFDTQTLIISKKVNGKEVKWKNLEKIWDLIADYEKFKKYVDEEIKKLMSES
jgi:hypothetical protein